MPQATRVTLVFPPHAPAEAPWLAVPVLRAALERAGHAVRSVDLNLAHVLHWCAPATIARHIDALPEDASLLRAALCATDLDAALATLRDPTTLSDSARRASARRALRLAFRAVEMRHPGLALGLHHAELGDLSRPDHVRPLLDDALHNPYVCTAQEWAVDRLLEGDPHVVGFSITLPSQLVPTLTLALALRRRAPQVAIICGGNVITHIADDLARISWLWEIVDGFVEGEGERALDAFVRASVGERSLGDVPSLLHAGRFLRDRVGETPIVQRNMRATVMTRDEIGAPVFDDLPLSDYLSPLPVLPVQSTRGCPWTCAFCDHAYGYSVNNEATLRKRDAARVVDDMQRGLERFGVRSFELVDEAPTPPELAAISEEILARGLDVRWITQTRITDKLIPRLPALRRAGLELVQLGYESGNDRVLTLMNKGTNAAMADRVIRAIGETGIGLHLHVFLGFPTETFEEARDTVDLIVRNAHWIDSVPGTEPGIFGLGRHAPILADPDKYGVIPDAESGPSLATWRRFTLTRGPDDATIAASSDYYRTQLSAIPHLAAVDGLSRIEIFATRVVTGRPLLRR